MAGISDEDIQKVREASDIVAIAGERVPLKQKGRDFWCCCPVHNEKTPSCKIDPVLQLWHCFGCGEGGDVFGFVMKTEDMNFPEAVRKLAERAHIVIEESAGSRGASTSLKTRIKEVCEKTAAFYHVQLMRSKSQEAAAARAYLAKRGLGGSVPKDWNLGFAPGRGALVSELKAAGYTPREMIEANVAIEGKDGRLRDRFFNRIMFPINDVQGECIAFGGRVVDKGEPKYLNSQETPVFRKSQVLFGLDHAKASMATTGIAIVVEGYTDVIALHEAGIKNVVATLGTALTMQHIRVLSRHANKRIVYLFDGDAAGQRAADRALQFIDEGMTPEAGKMRIDLCAVALPDDLDPADFIESRGSDALRELVDGAQPLLAYGIDRRLSGYDLSSPEGRSTACSQALQILAPIKDSLLAKDYALQIAGRTRQRENDVLALLAALKPVRLREERASRDETLASDSPSEGQAGYQANRLFRGAGSSAAPFEPSLSRAELSRRKTERRFLCGCAQNPTLALQYADVLAQTAWHDETCALLADALLELLSCTPQATPASIVGSLQETLPTSARILTSSFASDNPSDLLAYLAEDLGIGDAEEAIASLRAQLDADRSLDAEERDILFQSVVYMQKDLAARRKSHKPLSQ